MDRPVARTAVSAATFQIDRLYDYLIPDDIAARASAGSRVLVPFGRGNKKAEGIILSINNGSKYDKLKPIDSLIDEEPIFNAENIRLALWMRDRFFCTAYDALRCMLPAHVDYKRKVKGRERTPRASSGTPVIQLSSEQSVAFDGLLPLLSSNSPEAALLYGVTGSGKTSVYIQLIKKALELGRTAIVLVPEIGLTPQAVRIFESHFNNAVAVIHSALSGGERYTEWKRIRDGEVSVVVGTRSAVFAPLANLGLIVIDEEQEHTYKSENSPRYHARDVAKHRITHANGLLLLASATPSIDSMHAACSGKYKLFRLRGRYNEMSLPQVIIADMKKELKAGNGGQISSVLRRELEINIDSGQQSILFINRRGASSAVICGECGYTIKCRNCSVSMTYHLSVKRLMCHYCGFSAPIPDTCAQCGGKLKFVGAGTQKVEIELAGLFPGIEIIRMDADTTARKDSHNKLLASFRDSRAHVLLGTQMVTKGLDFENVTLVGVLCADQSLYTSDYRSSERTFSLITQVIGRGGRGSKPGRAVIQTFTPENETITLASKQDYDAFYKKEIEFRTALKSPPVKDLLSLTVTGTDENAVIIACDMLKFVMQNYFKTDAETRLLGPAPAPVSKINNRYVYKLMVSCKNTKIIRDTLGHIMREFAKDKKSRGVTVYADVDAG